MLLNFSLTSSLFCPEGIATADSYSAATHKVILDSISGQFTTEDMEAIAIKSGTYSGACSVTYKNNRQSLKVFRSMFGHFSFLNMRIYWCI